eukprot:332708_1
MSGQSDLKDLEYTLAITEWADVSGSILFIHSLSGQFLSDHITNDTHHSGTPVIELDIQFTCFFCGVLDVFAEPANTVVSIIFGCRHPGKFYKGKESKDL